MSVRDKPLLERVRAMRMMFAGATTALEALGWKPAVGVEACGTCHGGTTWRDPGDVPRHPWCTQQA